MSADSTSDEEQPIVDEEAVSEVIRKPTRTAGDLSEGGEASGGITLEGLPRRVQRIEEHLGISDPKKPEAFGRVTEPSPTVHIPRTARPPPHRDPAEDLLKKERERCANFAAKAVAAGLAERTARGAERQGQLMVEIVQAALREVDLSPEQVSAFKAALARQARELTASAEV